MSCFCLYLVLRSSMCMMAATELPPKEEQSVVFEELLEVITCVISNLSLDWPDEQATVIPSKLDNCHLTSGRVLPPCKKSPFFPHFHTEVSKFWKQHIWLTERPGLQWGIAIAELHQAKALVLRATKQTARTICYSMAVLVVMERHVCLNLTVIEEKDEAQILPQGLFGDTVNIAIDRYQEAKCQTTVFREIIPCRN